jgi:hypothetical protein
MSLICICRSSAAALDLARHVAKRGASGGDVDGAALRGEVCVGLGNPISMSVLVRRRLLAGVDCTSPSLHSISSFLCSMKSIWLVIIISFSLFLFAPKKQTICTRSAQGRNFFI